MCGNVCRSFFFVMFRMSFLFIIKINFDLLIVTAIA